MLSCEITVHLRDENVPILRNFLEHFRKHRHVEKSVIAQLNDSSIFLRSKKKAKKRKIGCAI